MFTFRANVSTYIRLYILGLTLNILFLKDTFWIYCCICVSLYWKGCKICKYSMNFPWVFRGSVGVRPRKILLYFCIILRTPWWSNMLLCHILSHILSNTSFNFFKVYFKCEYFLYDYNIWSFISHPVIYLYFPKFYLIHCTSIRPTHWRLNVLKCFNLVPHIRDLIDRDIRGDTEYKISDQNALTL